MSPSLGRVGVEFPFRRRVGVGSSCTLCPKMIRFIRINSTFAVHGNSKASTKAQHAYDIINTKTNKVIKTGISGGQIKNGKSVRAETQVKKWNKESGDGTYKSEITHHEPAGEGSRTRILDYEKERANVLREELKA